VTEAEKTLYRFVTRLNASRGQVRREEVEAVRAAGWSDEAVYDAITVAALFNFYNLWVDGAGVSPLPAEAYEESGRGMAERGYGG